MKKHRVILSTVSLVLLLGVLRPHFAQEYLHRPCRQPSLTKAV